MSRDNMIWRQVLTTLTQVDVTPVFQLPVDIIRDELLGSAILNRLNETRSAEERQRLKVPNVGQKPGGPETPYLHPTGWFGVALYNSSGDSRDIIISGFTAADSRKNFRSNLRELNQHQWTDASDQLPLTKQLIIDTFAPYLVLGFVRIMVLEPGGMITPHRDIPEGLEAQNRTGNLGVYNILNSFSASIIEPPGHKFYHDGRLLDFKPGRVKWLNNGREHWLVNMSQDRRVHLIVHGVYKKKFSEYISQNIQTMDYYPNLPIDGLEVSLET